MGGVTSLVISTMRGDIQDRLVQLGLSNGDAESMVMAWNLIVWIIYFSLIYWVTGSIRNLISIGWKSGSQRKDIFDSVSEKTSCETGKSMFFSEKEMERAGKAG